MRLVTLATAFAFVLTSGPVLVIANSTAEAQERTRTRITVTPRHYLDAGTKVKPGTARYHNYVLTPQMNYPFAGPGSPFGPSNQGLHPSGDGRYPLPGLFWLPGY